MGVALSNVLITGCSSGFGAAAACRFAQDGHTVFAGVRRLADAPNVSSGTIVPVELDVTSEESVTEAVKSVRDHAGSIDVLVNNAAVWLTGAIEETPIREMERVIDVNLLGPVRLLKAVVPVMRAQGEGVVVTISSMNGVIAMPQSGIYCASKFALEAMIETLVYELRDTGIRNVLIQPGVFDTGLHRRSVSIGDAGAAMAQMAADAAEEAPPLDIVVDAIVHAAFDATTPLRVPVGPDAEMLIGMRQSMSDDEFVAAMSALFEG
jgi:NAD(P)-dependent dehydrogenase (short-subunit alcohol dehydrogenase family)